MNEFWLWFWKPFAELLGSIALLAVIVGGFFVVWGCFFCVHEIRRLKKRLWRRAK